MLAVWIDGACQPVNPGGTAAYGLIVKMDGEVIHQDSKVIGSGGGMSNNVAEYCGLIAFLQWYVDRYKPVREAHMLPGVTIHSDSRLVVSQMNSQLTVRKGYYVPFYKRAAELMRFNGLWGLFDFEWVRRTENVEADRLSKAALLSRGIGVS